ncbi:hypothetical protein acsn021_08130 [Anaerocolumna cellulosilytica]|uniref:Uncharacterized protein n=1 Tax=Anaerocolumna cellulosilytica TaxID=433286 RepID=A0A6S6QRL2_9FIRM|nr:hypothetical protein [Anaerocolumna cellulosilytica]MBB5198148.1 hypothetical protein [Anaerocolumna cellulosilytica]BCJ93244.1 hypothetical protein acsn021_08130 [Anaerocolumna cellulosilytica]
MEQKMWKSLITMRYDIALEQLLHKKEYNDICEQQKKTESRVEELLQQLSKEDRRFIWQHYEGETAMENLELEAAYIQGLRDGVRALRFLGMFEEENAF